MKKLIFTYSLIAFVCFTVFSQTQGQYTLWSQNQYLINPAVAGSDDFLNIKSGFRRQWSGMKEAPRMLYATAHMALNKRSEFRNSALLTSKNAQEPNPKNKLTHAIGVTLNGSEFGAFSRKDFLATYALHLPLNNEYTISFGLSSGFSNYGFNSSKSEVLLDHDPTYAAYASGNNAYSFTSDFGTYLYHEDYYFGYAARQLINTEVDLTDGTVDQEGAGQQTTHLIMGGYRYSLSNQFILKPNVLMKIQSSKPLSYDINTTINYKESVYLGGAYRSGDAASLLFGLTISQLVSIGYAYDISLSEIKNQSSGSHEVQIGLRLY